MSINLHLRAPEVTELKPRITVLGVGGAGGNAVNNMINAKLEGVTFVVANTDAQALSQSKAPSRIQLGARLTEGLGAGAKPDVGRSAAEESIDEILEHLTGSHMVFITAGMGGGTGTGASPVIARAAREMGILTVGVVTKPFQFEGDRRMKVAERGIEELQNYVDTLIVIPNQNLFRVATDRTTFAQAFAMADDVLHSGVRGVTNLIVIPGLINRDFADIKTVMSELGKAMMGTGEMEGEKRALRAAEAAISNPLLDDVSMKGARAVLVHVTGGSDLTLFDVDEAVNRVRSEVDPDANILFGSALNENMEGRVRVSVVATGIDAEAMTKGLRGNVVQPLWPQGGRTKSAGAAANPVREQVETIEQGFGAGTNAMDADPRDVPAMVRMNEPMDLGGVDSPIMMEESAPLTQSGLHRPEPMMTRYAPPEREKRRFGLFGSRKRETRVEPVSNAPSPSPMRMAAEAQAVEPAPQAAEDRTPPKDDLFSGAPEDDRLEIPAFLRRQANSGS